MSFSSSSRDGEFPLHGDKFKFVATFPASSENDPIFSVVAANPTVECLEEVWAQYCHQLTSPKSRDGDIASNFVAPFSKIALAAHVLLSVLRSSLTDTIKSNPAVGGSPLFARTEADLHRYQALRVVFTEFSQLCKSEPHTAAAMVRENSR